jgi:hypothetical protein
MRTNNKQVREAIRKHITECVYINDEPATKFEDAKKEVKILFEHVANHPYNLKKIPNNQERFSDFLCGLHFNFHFYNEDIKDFLNGLGINPQNKTFSSEKSLYLYHYLIFREVFN